MKPASAIRIWDNTQWLVLVSLTNEFYTQGIKKQILFGLIPPAFKDTLIKHQKTKNKKQKREMKKSEMKKFKKFLFFDLGLLSFITFFKKNFWQKL